MINKQEILEQARKYNLSPHIIEKDYVISWILTAIAHQESLSKHWVFKGGTCLKKCFFEYYRFSEDLDFTIIDSQHINTQFLQESFYNIAQWIYDYLEIELPKELIQFEIYKNPREGLSVEGRIGYKGPLQRQGNIPRIKLDLTNDEKIVLKPEIREIYHHYTDTPTFKMEIQAYCLEEIYAEKLRALTERLRPRDLYDVIHLHYDERWKPNKNNMLLSLSKKCEYKNINMPTLALLNNKAEKNELIQEWENMLAHQISDLKPFDYYWELLPPIFDWLYN